MFNLGLETLSKIYFRVCGKILYLGEKSPSGPMAVMFDIGPMIDQYVSPNISMTNQDAIISNDLQDNLPTSR